MNNNHYLLGLLGHPVSHSLSPVLHNAALAHYGLDGEYKAIDVEAFYLEETLDRLEAEGTRGLNVTIPHKQAVMEFLQELSPDVAAIGAVNTIIFERNDNTCLRRGENTDVHGFSTAFGEEFAERGLSLENATTGDVLLLGYGGAARAVVTGLNRLGFSTIRVVGRNTAFIESFCTSCRSIASLIPFDSYTNESLSNVSVAINATPLGQHGEPVPQAVLRLFSELPKNCFVYDLVYSRNNASTPLVETCNGLGLRAADGLGMLVHQAAKAFELWTGLPGPVGVMVAAVHSSSEM